MSARPNDPPWTRGDTVYVVEPGPGSSLRFGSQHTVIRARSGHTKVEGEDFFWENHRFSLHSPLDKRNTEPEQNHWWES